MARARNLKPGFFRNADLAEFDPWTRLLFAGLWLLADREGRLEDKPKQIKVELFPCDTVDIDAMLQDMAARAPDMLQRYQVDGKRYLQVVNFRKHQNPHRDEKPSTIPDPLGNLAAPPEPKKPGANTVQTPEQPDGTIETPCLHGASTGPIGLNPESCILNPDSLNLNPPTHKPDPRPENQGGLSTDAVDKSILSVLEGAGISGVFASPELRALVSAGADAATFAQAAQIAVTKKIPTFAYVLGVVTNRLGRAGNESLGPESGPPGVQGGNGGGVGAAGAPRAPEAPPSPPAKPPPGFFDSVRRALGGQGGAVPGAA